MTLMSRLSGCDRLRDSSSEKLITSEAWKLLIYRCQITSCKNKLLQWNASSQPPHPPRCVFSLWKTFLESLQEWGPHPAWSACSKNINIVIFSMSPPLNITAAFSSSLWSTRLCKSAQISISVFHISRAAGHERVKLFTGEKRTFWNALYIMNITKNRTENLLQISVGAIIRLSNCHFSKHFNCHHFF